MHAVLTDDAHERVGGEPVEHVGPVAAGLFVLPRARDQHVGLDVLHELRRRERITAVGEVVGELRIELGRRVRVVEGLLLQVDVLAAQQHVVGTRGVAVVDAIDHPPGCVRVRPLVLLVPLGSPTEREAVVEDAARVQGAAPRVVDDRDRRDRVEVRWRGPGHEELTDPGVGDADHADVTVGPRLGRDGFDRVVAVERLQVLEEVERAARAATPADVDADPRVTARGHQQLVLRLAGGGARRVVARVLEHGGVRTVLRRAGEHDLHGELRAVTGGEVAVPGVVPEVGDLEVLVRIERLVGRGELVEDGDRPAGDGGRAVVDLDRVSRVRLQVVEVEATEAVDRAGLEHDALADHGDGRTRWGVQDRQLVHAAAHDQTRGCRGGDGGTALRRRARARTECRNGDGHDHRDREKTNISHREPPR